jgi:peptide/nickel transport system ATP-binding protein
VSLLEVDKLSVRYPGRGRRSTPFTAVDAVSFTIGEGQTLAVVGESGSGKTSIGRAVLGLVQPAAGRILLDGAELPPGAAAPARRDIQAVFQDPFGSLSPMRTIGQTLAEPLAARGGGRTAARSRLAELLDLVGIDPRSLDRYPREFSGGQRQRIAIARALALDPRLIVCDEPVSALDLTTQRVVLDLLIRLQRETGVAYLFITHDLAVVRYIGHKVAVVQDGRVLEQGDALDVLERPQHPYTRDLLFSSPLPDVEQQADRRRARNEALNLIEEST